MTATPSGSIHVENPATGELLRELPAAGAPEVQAAVARARDAQPGWAALPFAQRARALRRFARALRDDGELLDTLVAESGKPRYEAELIELFYTLELTRYYTGRAGRRALGDEVHHPLVFSNKRTRVGSPHDWLCNGRPNPSTLSRRSGRPG